MFVFLLFVIGVCVGSFLNVLIDRIPREESVVKGRSHCEKCKKNLEWHDLIPLFSFIFLRGKCRFCRSSIGLYYPIVELTTGLLFVFSFLLLPDGSIKYQVLSIKYLLFWIYYFFIISSLIVIFFTDLKYGIIPDKIIYPAIFVSSLFLIFQYPGIPISNFLSAVGGFVFFFLLFLITKGKGMGFGDVKLVFLMGLFLGFPKIIAVLYISFLTGAIVSLILVLGKKKNFFGGTVPFGPFLIFGTIIAWFFGKIVLQKILPYGFGF